MKNLPESIEHKNQIENIIFEGGGIRGICFAGSLQKLDEMHILPQIQNIAGTSAGAFIAMTLAIGYTPSEIQTVLEELDFKKFQDSGFNRGGPAVSFFKKVYNILCKFGWYQGDELHKWLCSLVKNKTGENDLTFKEVYQLFNKNLVMTGTNLSKASTEYFSYQTTPDMSICLAARISGSLPLVFKPIKYKKDLFIDGGFLNNYPIWVFDKPGQLTTYPIFDSNPKTLGLKIIEKDIKTDQRFFYGALNTDKFHNYCMSLIECMQYQIERGYISPGYWERTVAIEIKDIGVTEFDITLEKKREIIDRGYDAVEKYFNSTKYYNQLSYKLREKTKKHRKKRKVRKKRRKIKQEIED